jgi:hypothetical protein
MLLLLVSKMHLIRNLLFLCVCSLCANARSIAATPQLFDKLEFQGKTYSIIDSLFERVLLEYGDVEFTSQSSDNHKGYEATWAIRDGVLYLDQFSGWVGRKEVTLEEVWPNLTPTPTKAKWISGEVNVVPGVLTTNSIGNTTERALTLFFIDGELIHTKQLRKFKIGTEVGGIGLSVAFDSERRVVVQEVHQDGPCAEHPFVRPGVQVIAVQLEGKEIGVSDSLSRAIGLIRGREKSDVTIVVSDHEGKSETLTLTRVPLAKLARPRSK